METTSEIPHSGGALKVTLQPAAPSATQPAAQNDKSLDMRKKVFLSDAKGYSKSALSGEGGRTRAKDHLNTTVIKRNGRAQPFTFAKLEGSVARMCFNLAKEVDATSVISGLILSNECRSRDITEETAARAASLARVHPHYLLLGGRLLMRSLHKDTPKSFSKAMENMYSYVDPRRADGLPTPQVSDAFIAYVYTHKDVLDAKILVNHDFNFSYFAVKTLERSYITKQMLKDGTMVPVETPQYMYMRVAVQLHGLHADAQKSDDDGLSAVLQTYTDLSTGILSHASPTLFQAGRSCPQLSSCFLMTMQRGILDPGDTSEDSIDSFYATLHACAMVSKYAGGIGVHAHKVRARGTYISGTSGQSNGILPLFRNFNATARYVDQGGGKRPGAFAIYMEPWHGDIFDFLDLRKNTGTDEERCRDLNIGLWVPDLFMKRVEEDGDWTLMCPHTCPGLSECWGEEFEKLYTKYERENRGMRTIRAQELWRHILDAQIETGEPYMLFKDTCNRKSNHKHLGTLKGSNLCVSGSTTVLTDLGPRTIRSLKTVCHSRQEDRAAELKKRRDLVQQHDTLQEEVHKYELMLRKLCTDKELVLELEKAEQAKLKDESRRQHRIQQAKMRLFKTCANKDLYNKYTLALSRHNDLEPRPDLRLIEELPDPKPRTVNVWNGEKFAPVVVERTTQEDETKRLLRITTSYGARIECTPEHKFILSGEARERVPASALKLGDELTKPQLVQYPGRQSRDWADHDSFRRGFVRGIILSREGAKPENLGMREPSVRVEMIVVEKECLSADELVLLGYDEEHARRHLKGEEHNHEFMAYISLLPGSEREQKARTKDQMGIVPLDGPVRTRYMWFCGFMAAVRRRLANARASYAMLYKTWMLIRSLCLDARLTPADAEGRWVLSWPKEHTTLEADEALKFLEPPVEHVDEEEAKFLREREEAKEAAEKAAEVEKERLRAIEEKRAAKKKARQAKINKRRGKTMKAEGAGRSDADDDDDDDDDDVHGDVHDGKRAKGTDEEGKQDTNENEEKPKSAFELLVDKLREAGDRVYEKLPRFVRVGTDAPTITGIEWVGGEHETFCFTEEGRHVGYFEYMETGQCTEIQEYTSPDEISVCTLASIALPRCVKYDKNEDRMCFDFQILHDITRRATVNLNHVIDINYYPLAKQMSYSNLRHRPIGLGVQGLADVMFLLKEPFDGPTARELNLRIFETIYHAALTQSIELAKVEGPYSTYEGSPLSKGILQPDMWGVEVTDDLWDWTELRANLKQYGARNSLLVAPMPTASTAQILGNNNCIEPLWSNMFVRGVLSGYFQVINRYLVQDLIELGLWNATMAQRIIDAEGSVQNIEEIPPRLRQIYRTVWEIPQRSLIDMDADRGAFVDQSISSNRFMSAPNHRKLTAMHFHAHKRGCKTGMYYLRVREESKAAAVASRPKAFTDNSAAASHAGAAANAAKEVPVCRRDKPGCVSCGA